MLSQGSPPTPSLPTCGVLPTSLQLRIQVRRMLTFGRGSHGINAETGVIGNRSVVDHGLFG